MHYDWSVPLFKITGTPAFAGSSATTPLPDVNQDNQFPTVFRENSIKGVIFTRFEIPLRDNQPEDRTP
jgi:hypothetical protein